jgi:hypothetical protein
MKIKKALKRLNKVETLLTNIIDQCPASARGLRELLDSAKASAGPSRAGCAKPAFRGGPSKNFSGCQKAMGRSQA